VDCESAIPEEIEVRSPIRTVRLDELAPADSPRSDGEDEAHIRLLATADARLPPILVHRGTMRVIDGMHRLRAARLRGDETIEVRYYEGCAELAFVLGVRANVTHGLPLSLADRETAAARILALYPQWSDRAIAEASGLAAKTVKGIRRCTTGDHPQLHSRIGRDGRARPLDSERGRRLAGEVLAARPGASLREVARIAGVSPSTVRDVQQRMRRGEDPVPPKRRAHVPSRRRTTTRDQTAALRALMQDPSLRLSVKGRDLLRWLRVIAVERREWHQVVDTLPGHCMETVAEVARGCAQELQKLADELERRNPMGDDR
jgi:ParB-like chromosome segregation protein Spo0J